MFDVQIVSLEPMQVAYAHGFGASPEEQAWETLLTWVNQQGLDPAEQLYFGHNNPDPSPGSPNYGYDVWVVIDGEVEPTDTVKLKSFDGGLYAVTRCKLPEIGEAWRQLVAWCEDSKYQFGVQQCLEKNVTPPEIPFEDTVMDIYLSIIE